VVGRASAVYIERAQMDIPQLMRTGMTTGLTGGIIVFFVGIGFVVTMVIKKRPIVATWYSMNPTSH
jgi:hypothetical protein